MTIEMEYAKLIENFNSEYASLMKYFLYLSKSHVEQPNVLNDLKNHYSSVIDSARTSDYINSLEDLLRILEKRNELSHDNITPLIYIESRYVRNPELARSLNNYERTLGDRPVVPLFNIYDLPNGKYNVEKTDITRDTRPVNENLNDKFHRLINHERTIRDFTNTDALEYSQATGFAVEDTLPDDTEHSLCRRVVKIDEPRLDAVDDNIFNANARRTLFYFAPLVILSAVLLLAILLMTMCNACLSETPRTPRPGSSGTGASNSDESPRHQIRAEMTLYTTTEPRFRLTLPGAVEIDPTKRNSDYRDAEVARAVFLEVSDKVGRHWRDMARFLGVTEHDIDEIDYHSQLPLKEKAYQALLKFQLKCDPPQWKSKLERALEKARRRDLTEMVENMWSRKH